MANALSVIYSAAFVITHLVGFIVAIVLLVRVKGTPAILATVAFGLMLLNDIGHGLRSWFVDALLFRYLRDNISVAMEGLNCCCALIPLAGFVCLIIAIWQAVKAGVRPAV